MVCLETGDDFGAYFVQFFGHELSKKWFERCSNFRELRPVFLRAAWPASRNADVFFLDKTIASFFERSFKAAASSKHEHAGCVGVDFRGSDVLEKNPDRGGSERLFPDSPYEEDYSAAGLEHSLTLAQCAL